MNWTKEPPSEPGIYWYRYEDDDSPEIVSVSLEAWGVRRIGSDVFEDLDDFIDDNDIEWWPERLVPPK